MNSIQILLSTYNGEKYLEEQLNSLLAQTYKEWYCLIRDDGSTDGTIEIINRYVERYPHYFSFYKDNDRNLGPCKSFLKLLEMSNADYYMFCDQDDVWLNEKIELTYNEIKKMELLYSKEIPLLVHSDLEVVNNELQTIADSMFDLQRMDSSLVSLKNLMIQNNITGCTMMINNKVKSYLNKYSEHIMMHDWWLGLIAAAIGKIGFVNQPLIRYRQHGENSVGAKGMAASLNLFIKKRNKSNLVSLPMKQASAFLKAFEEILTEGDKQLLIDYSTFLDKSFISRLNSLIKFNYKKTNWVKDIAYKFLLLTAKE